MLPSNRKSIRTIAFQEIKPWTQAIKGLPPRNVLFERCLQAVRKAAFGKSLSHTDTRAIADEITVYVLANFDPRKRNRQPPKTSRRDRADNDRLVVEVFQDVQDRGLIISTRDLSKYLGASSRQVARILERHKIDCGIKIEGYALTPDVEEVLTSLQKIVPPGSKRILSDWWMAEVLSTNDPTVEALWVTLNALENSVTGWHFFPAPNEVIVCRGRKLTVEEVHRWRETARPASFLRPKRDLQDFGRQVWADLLAVTAVSQLDATADDWRAFLRVVTVTPGEMQVLRQWAECQATATQLDLSYLEKLVCEDRETLVTRVRKALRHRTNAGYVDAIHAWNREYSEYASVIGELLYTIQWAEGLEFSELIQMWINLACYEARVNLGLIPGRAANDISKFLDAARDHETNGVFLNAALAAIANQHV